MGMDSYYRSKAWTFYSVGQGQGPAGKLECSVGGTWQLEVLGGSSSLSCGLRGLQAYNRKFK